jgi:hypothetical protein
MPALRRRVRSTASCKHGFAKDGVDPWLGGLVQNRDDCVTEDKRDESVGALAGYICAEWIDPASGSTPCFFNLTYHKQVRQAESWGSR